jgi:hypothetical protein
MKQASGIVCPSCLHVGWVSMCLFAGVGAYSFLDGAHKPCDRVLMYLLTYFITYLLTDVYMRVLTYLLMWPCVVPLNHTHRVCVLCGAMLPQREAHSTMKHTHHYETHIMMKHTQHDETHSTINMLHRLSNALVISMYCQADFSCTYLPMSSLV